MNRIRDLRERRGVSQKLLALELSVKQPSVCSWEKGVKNPSNKNAKKLADYFGVSMDYLLGRSDDHFEQPAVTIDGLREEVIQLLLDLSDADLRRVEDFVAGLKAGRGADAALQRSVPPEVP